MIQVQGWGLQSSIDPLQNHSHFMTASSTSPLPSGSQLPEWNTEQEEEEEDLIQEETNLINDHQYLSPLSQSHSQSLPIYDDPQGSMFSGPAAESVPSSATHMQTRSSSHSRSTRNKPDNELDSDTQSIQYSPSKKHRATRRKHSVGASSVGTQRRSSRSNRPVYSAIDAPSDTGASERSIRRGRRRKPDPRHHSSGDESGVGFFSNLSAMFKGKSRDHGGHVYQHQPSRSNSNRRRTSMSRSIRSATSSWRSLKSSRSKSRLASANSYRDNPDDEFDPDVDDSDYAPTISSVSTSTTNSDPSSSDSSLRSKSHPRDTFTLGSMPDSRIEIIPLSTTHTADGDLFLDEQMRLNPNSRQSVYFVDEDMQINFFGWALVFWKDTFWNLGCICSLGLLWLIGRWKIAWMLNSRGAESPFPTASHLVINTNTGDAHVVKLKTLIFTDPLPLIAVFPPSLRSPPASRDESAALVSLALPSEAESLPPLPQTRHSSDTLAQSCNSSSTPPETIRLTQIKYFDFRYHRFFLHPITMQFRMARDWQDPSWSLSLPYLAKGLDDQQIKSRSQLFSDNVMEVKGKTTAQILVDEVSQFLLSYGHAHGTNSFIPTHRHPYLGSSPFLSFPNRFHHTLVVG